ncbi:MAG: xanthine dehydrogenase family protein subunit M [Gammaproteobacteria bacterium]|jgi:carbon-monoxide dehydrogenase medium subunit|nr:carbon monoxide dehydrogenase [Chromatiales bacterium]MDP6673945.1 xanthine dehydrogenase family protein subunit M [Gammaproteobacteria bacterium]
MYPAPFHYHRAESLEGAISLLAELGDSARALAGGQTLLVWMKLRFDEPQHLVDVSRIPGLSEIRQQAGDEVCIGALATHAEIARSAIAEALPNVLDCGSGIADAQIRSRGTIGGALGSADPSCDWPTLLHTFDAVLTCTGPEGTRTIPVSELVEDIYTTILKPAELITEIRFKIPPENSGGAYCGFKRCAPAYPTASAGVQLTLEDDICSAIRIALGSAGLTTITSQEAEAVLQGNPLTEANIDKATEAIVAAADPVPDQRGSEDFKRAVLRTLVKRAIDIAGRRCHGEIIKGHHEYV